MSGSAGGVERLTISLPAELAEAVREAATSHRFASISEVVRDALREWLLTESDREKAVGRPRKRVRECTDMTKLQLAGIITGCRFSPHHSLCHSRLGAEAGGGSGRDLRATAALRDASRRGTIQPAIVPVVSWRQVVKLVLFDSVEDPTEWTLVYDADLPGSDTESSSTS